jgi:hypothetical protein
LQIIRAGSSGSSIVPILMKRAGVMTAPEWVAVPDYQPARLLAEETDGRPATKSHAILPQAPGIAGRQDASI